MSKYKTCWDCTEFMVDNSLDAAKLYLYPNCDTCDDLIGETEEGRVYRNNRPGREEVIFSEIKTPKTTVRYHDDINSMDIDFEPLEMEKTVAYLQKHDKEEVMNRQKARLEKAKADAADLAAARKAVGLPQATGPDDVGRVGSEIAIPSDVVPTPFVNYKRPLASPHMEIKVPVETETGIVMPPLPKHECELPKAVKTVEDKWESRKNHDEVVFPDGSTYTCLCGKNWYVRVQKVPYHISQYDPQYVFAWRPVRWFNFSRKADIHKRKEQ